LHIPCGRYFRPLILRSGFLCFMFLLWLVSTPPAHSSPSDGTIAWKKTLTAGAKGTRTSIPRGILSRIRTETDPDECGDSAPIERVKADAYAYRRGRLSLIAVWGRSSCFCSPTGNCVFWIFSLTPHGYRLLLKTDMVREFGFLPSMTHDLPDLVLWSHNSAFLLLGALWRFDGHSYKSTCGWEIVTTHLDLPNG
jgi:hypothetical protein